GDMRRVSADAVKDASNLGRLPGHSRELSVRRIDDAVNDQQRKRQQTEAFVVEKRAGRHADGTAGEGELVWRQPQRPRRESGHGTEWTEKIDIGQLFDFVRLEGQRSVKHLTRVYSVVAEVSD